jgi:hypothetical protein
METEFINNAKADLDKTVRLLNHCSALCSSMPLYLRSRRRSAFSSKQSRRCASHACLTLIPCFTGSFLFCSDVVHEQLLDALAAREDAIRAIAVQLAHEQKQLEVEQLFSFSSPPHLISSQ